MALSADDRLLGEKTHYYCSSSEEEGEDGGEEGKAQGSAADDCRHRAPKSSRPKFVADEEATSYNGHCSNTGPKGVIEDWRKYRQMETEKREDQELERLALAKKLSLTCRTAAEDDRERQKDAAFQQQLEAEFDDLSEQFLNEYRQKRLEELRRTLDTVPRFGSVLELNREMYLDAIDKENPSVAVIIHIYEKGLAACEVMNKCLDSLAKEHLSAKFCRIKASEVRLSLNFAISGIPALLVYRHGEMIGNFVRLGDELGDDFCPSDVESFLVENGMLRDEPSAALSGVIRTSSAPVDSDSD